MLLEVEINSNNCVIQAGDAASGYTKKLTLECDWRAFSLAKPIPQWRHTKGREGSAGGGGEGGEGGEGGVGGGLGGVRARRDHCCVRADVMCSHTPF